MKYVRLIWLPVLVITGSLVLAACSGSAATTPKPAAQTSSSSAPTVDAGNLYSTYCSTCHGANREGKTGAGPALSAQSLSGKTDAQIKEVIQNGKSNTAMPAWKDRLSGDQINALVQYVKANK